MNAYTSSAGWNGAPLDMAYNWDYTTPQSPKAIVSQYNDLLQRAADFYSTLDASSSGSRSSSVSERSYRSTSERPGTSSVIAQVRKSIPDKIERRREQNRSSQRAYRDRKERHQRELEQQISQWQHKHQLLSRSYSKQSEEVSRLKSQIDQLNGEITALQSGLPSLCGSLCQSPTEFDLVPFYDPSELSPTSPKLHHSYTRM